MNETNEINEFQNEVIRQLKPVFQLDNNNTFSNFNGLVELFFRDYISISNMHESYLKNVKLNKIIFESTSNKAYSRKLKNLKFNIGDFLQALTEGTLSLVGTKISIPVAIIGFLVTIRSALQALKINISSDEAIILFTFWLLKNQNRKTNLNAIEKVSNKEFKKYGRNKLSKSQLLKTLQNLILLGCIKEVELGKEYVLIETINTKRLI